MLETRSAEFEVVGGQNNHLWFQVLSGGDQGLRVSVPVRDPEYDEELQQTLSRLSEGDVVKATLKSESEDRPNWKINELEVIDYDIVTGPLR